MKLNDCTGKTIAPVDFTTDYMGRPISREENQNLLNTENKIICSN
jgi:hypothetical protein